MICPLVAAHSQRNRACVSRTDHGRLAQYGCDGAHEETGLGRELVQPASLSLCHHDPVILNSANKARKGITEQFISLLLIRVGQGSNNLNVSQSHIAVSELHWQRISIDLVPALEQTAPRCEHLQSFPKSSFDTWQFRSSGSIWGENPPSIHLVWQERSSSCVLSNFPA